MLREIISTEIYTVLLVICLLLVSISKLLFPKRFQDFVIILFNFRYLKIYIRDQKFLDTFEGLLFANLIIGLSILSLLSYNLSADIGFGSLITLYKLAFAIALLFIIKILIERIISSILDIENVISNYIFAKTSYKNCVGLILIPLNTLLIYTLNISLTFIIVIVGLLLIIYLVGLFIYMKDNLKLIKNNFFYFILYLCALEISPYLILYKLVINK